MFCYNGSPVFMAVSGDYCMYSHVQYVYSYHGMYLVTMVCI